MKIKQVAVYKDYVFEQKDVREAVKDITLDEKQAFYSYSFCWKRHTTWPV